MAIDAPLGLGCRQDNLEVHFPSPRTFLRYVRGRFRPHKGNSLLCFLSQGIEDWCWTVMETKMIHMDGLHMPFPGELVGPPGSHSVRTRMCELTALRSYISFMHIICGEPSGGKFTHWGIVECCFPCPARDQISDCFLHLVTSYSSVLCYELTAAPVKEPPPQVWVLFCGACLLSSCLGFLQFPPEVQKYPH